MKLDELIEYLDYKDLINFKILILPEYHTIPKQQKRRYFYMLSRRAH